MRDALMRLTLAAFLGLGLTVVAEKSAFAGGGSFDDMDDDIPF